MSDDDKFCDTFIREVRVNYLHTNIERFKILDPSDAARFIRSILTDNSREHFIALFLDTAAQVASYSIISIGTANSSLVHPREVFQRAITAGANAIIIAHNHPSGVLTPSAEDIKITKCIKEAGVLLSIKLLDHLIVSDTSYYSFQETACL